MLMTDKEIRSYLGEIIYYRARDYYEKENVVYVLPDGDGYRAEVKGSGFSSYTVFITPYGRHTCNCPYGGPCKHIGAVLLEIIYQEERSISYDPVEEFRTYKRTSNSWIESFDKKHKIDNQWKEFDGSGKDKSEFLLQFQVVCSSNRRPVVKAVLRYIKQNGTLGRTEEVNYRKNVIDLDLQSEMLMENFTSTNLYENSLHEVFPMFEYLDETIFYKDKPVVSNTFFRVEVTFKPTVTDGSSVLFSPEISFYKMDQVVGEKLPIRDIECSGGRITAFNKKEGVILTYEFFDNLYGFMYKICRFKTLGYGDVLEFMERYSDPGLVDMIFTQRGVKVSNSRPTPILKMREGYRGLHTDIYFRYGDEEILFSSRKQHIKAVVYEEYIETFERDDGFELLFEDYLKTIIPEFKGADSWEDYQLLYRGGSFTQFLKSYGDQLINDGVVINFNKKDISLARGSLSFGTKSGIDWFDIELYLKDEHENLLRASTRDFNASMMVSGNSFIVLDQKSRKILEQLKRQAKDTGTGFRVDKNNFSIIDIVNDSLVEEPDKEFLNRVNIAKSLKSFTAIEQVPVSKGFNGKLRDYQQAGYNWLNFLHIHELGGCLADDMGLGKTIQTLALLQKLVEQVEFSTTLLVVPVVTMGNWEKECKKFTPNIDIYRHDGPKRTKYIDFLMDCDIILVSYHTLLRDIELFRLTSWYYLILDEAQYIKNPKTKMFKAIRSLEAKHRLSLTGTPVENSSTDLYAQMDFLNPGILGSLEGFRKVYAKPIDRDGNKELETEFGDRVKPLILQRKKEDVLDELPEKEVIIQYCEMGKKQKKLYEQYRDIVRKEISGIIEKKGVEKSTISILDALLKLRQITLFPGLLDSAYDTYDSCKMDNLKIMLEDIIADGHKVLIFSQFVKTLERIETYLTASGVSYSKITGQTKNREKEIETFNGCNSVFLLSLKAGGVGINLTSADYVILFDPWWNPAVESQAIDRCHRIGQQNRVFAYKMIVKDSIEEKILELQEKKRLLADGLVTTETGIFKTLDRDDIMGLFS